MSSQAHNQKLTEEGLKRSNRKTLREKIVKRQKTNRDVWCGHYTEEKPGGPRMKALGDGLLNLTIT